MNKKINKICQNCGKTMIAKGVRGKNWKERKFCSRSCYFSQSVPWNKGIRSWVKPWLNKLRPSMVGRLNWAWKESGASYTAVHDWIRKSWDGSDTCEVCGRQGSNSVIHWANKDHQYRRLREDWMRLCVSCHREYDMKNNR